MIQTVKKTIANEHGFVLGTSILVSAVLILAGVFAVWMANTEMLLVRNEGQMIREFYDAEAGLVNAIENYNAPPDPWLTNEFLLDGDDAYKTIDYDIGEDAVATIEVRCILDNVADTPLTESADDLPLQPHVGPPPVGSGYSLKYFQVRRYGLTATSAQGNTQLQVGVFKIFNKY